MGSGWVRDSARRFRVMIAPGIEWEKNMASPVDNVSMALFCDFENVALGVRDTQHEKFDIKPVLERLLLKGSIVVKKAYCDWERYKGFKATMHEANFELIEIPHVRQSGKNSADIRLVVDALDLCYTKSHVNTFVIISGDTDFSPLVSKLRENAKQVIGVGVKQSTSDLLIANCDEFIFYDDLVRESQRMSARRQPREVQPPVRRSPDEERQRRDEEGQRKDELEVRRSQAIEMAVETFDALQSERGDSGKIWASVLKEAIKRRKPDFNETYYGFRAFGNLLEEAQARGLLEFGRDDKSGAYVFRSGTGNQGVASGTGGIGGGNSNGNTTRHGGSVQHDEQPEMHGMADERAQHDAPPDSVARREPRRRGGRGGRGQARSSSDADTSPGAQEPPPARARPDADADARSAPEWQPTEHAAPESESDMPTESIYMSRARAARAQVDNAPSDEPPLEVVPEAPAGAPPAAPRKTTARSRGPRKPRQTKQAKGPAAGTD